MKQNFEHIYTFSSPRFYICMKAYNLAEAIDYLRITFGSDWVNLNIDSLDIAYNKTKKQ